MFLMPSRYEPCGLNQMYSLRYGTIPIVRNTGGLADSVQHFDPATRQGTGCVFNDLRHAGGHAGPQHDARLVRAIGRCGATDEQRDGAGFFLGPADRPVRVAVTATSRRARAAARSGVRSAAHSGAAMRRMRRGEPCGRASARGRRQAPAPGVASQLLQSRRSARPSSCSQRVRSGAGPARQRRQPRAPAASAGAPGSSDGRCARTYRPMPASFRRARTERAGQRRRRPSARADGRQVLPAVDVAVRLRLPGRSAGRNKRAAAPAAHAGPAGCPAARQRAASAQCDAARAERREHASGAHRGATPPADPASIQASCDRGNRDPGQQQQQAAVARNAHDVLTLAVGAGLAGPPAQQQRNTGQQPAPSRCCARLPPPTARSSAGSEAAERKAHRAQRRRRPRGAARQARRRGRGTSSVHGHRYSGSSSRYLPGRIAVAGRVLQVRRRIDVREAADQVVPEEHRRCAAPSGPAWTRTRPRRRSPRACSAGRLQLPAQQLAPAPLPDHERRERQSRHHPCRRALAEKPAASAACMRQ